MKQTLFLSIFFSIFATVASCQNQNEDKSKRPSPPTQVSQKLESGATITIKYGQVSLKNRTIGKDVEPMEGEVWRTGANEATTFKADKDVTVNGAPLAAGTYGFFTIYNKDNATVIFNKTSEQWGAFAYKEEDDMLRVQAQLERNISPGAEKLTISVSQSGIVNILWGDTRVTFEVK